MSRTDDTYRDFRETVDIINKQSIPLTDKELQAISQSLFSISMTLGMIYDKMEEKDDKRDDV